MREEERNEMLVADDKYEAYRLGYKRGHDRGYGFREQQDRSEMLDLKAALVRRDETIDQYADEIIARGRYTLTLKAEKGALKEKIATGDSFLKIAHNDIAAFLKSEDRMKEEMADLRRQITALKVDVKLAKGERQW